MERRAFIQKFGVGSTSLVAASALAGVSASAKEDPSGHGRGGRALSSATLSFGAWIAEPPLDRFPNASPIPANLHQIVPFHTKIKAGGTVNFVISGLHQVIIYGPGTLPEHINFGLTTVTTGTPPGVPLINDPTNRVYRGVDPSLHPRDRVEVVQLVNPGRYLAICGVGPHFNDDMFAFIDVLPAEDDD
jgi:hypothetical protein